MATQAHAQLDEEAAPPPRCIVSGNVTNGVNALRDRSWKTFSFVTVKSTSLCEKTEARPQSATTPSDVQATPGTSEHPRDRIDNLLYQQYVRSIFS